MSEMPNIHCPSCRRPMVIREGRHGHFFGCTGYPEDCTKTLTVKQAVGIARKIEGRKSKSKRPKRPDFVSQVRALEVANKREGKRKSV